MKHFPTKQEWGKWNTLYKTNKFLCLSFEKNKKEIFRKSCLNRLFWKTVKPLLPDNVAGKDEIHLIENSELPTTDLETAEVLNNSFSNILQNLDISRYLKPINMWK